MHFKFVGELIAYFHLVDLCKFSDSHLKRFAQSPQDLRELLLLLLGFERLYVLLEESFDVDDVFVVIIELASSFADLT